MTASCTPGARRTTLLIPFALGREVQNRVELCDDGRADQLTLSPAGFTALQPPGAVISFLLPTELEARLPTGVGPGSQATVVEAAAPSRMEQSVEVGSGRRNSGHECSSGR